MKKNIFFGLLVAAIAHVGPATAQTRQAATQGAATGDPTYSLRVVGSDGVVYKCLPTLEVRGAEQIRRCLQIDAPVTTTQATATGAGTATGAAAGAGAGATTSGVLAGTALGAGGAAAAGALGVLLIVAGSGGSSTTTTTTSTSD